MKSPPKLVLLALALALVGWFALRFVAGEGRPMRTGSARIEAEQRKPAEEIASPARSDARTALDAGESTPTPTPGPPRMTLRVLDEQSGEIVPFLAMSVSGAGASTEEVVTDSDGIA